MKMGYWNVNSWNYNDQEIITESTDTKYTNVQFLKPKSKVSIKYKNCSLLFRGKGKKTSLLLLLHERYEQNIVDVDYVNDKSQCITL